MGFSESIKLEVKRKAAFRCCRCQQISVEVHHIKPVKDGGSDDIENAAPLCPSCHAAFGDNQEKRREITQMRDWWYDTCIRKYGANPDELENAAKLDAVLIGMDKQRNTMEDLKRVLRQMANRVIDEMTPVTATITASRIASMATESGTSCFQRVDLGPDEAVVVCRGDIDMHTAGVFGAVLTGAVTEPDNRRVIVDLTDTLYIDSTAIACLVHGLMIMKPRGGRLELVVTSPRVLDIISKTGLYKVFEIYPSRQDAGIG